MDFKSIPTWIFRIKDFLSETLDSDCSHATRPSERFANIAFRFAMGNWGNKFSFKSALNELTAYIFSDAKPQKIHQKKRLAL